MREWPCKPDFLFFNPIEFQLSSADNELFTAVLHELDQFVGCESILFGSLFSKCRLGNPAIILHYDRVISEEVCAFSYVAAWALLL